MSGKPLNYEPIEELMNKDLKGKMSSVKKGIIPIIYTVATCARMGIGLRGHRDESKYHPIPGGYSETNVGNFIRLINFAIRRGDFVLEPRKKCPEKCNISFPLFPK